MGLTVPGRGDIIKNQDSFFKGRFTMITIHDTIPNPGRKDKSGPLYIDIETTGLDRKASIIYMIGCGYHKGDSFHLIQWFNDDARSEKEILLAFFSILSEGRSETGEGIATFNGKQFDFPFLEYHGRQHGLHFDFSACDSLDYYQVLRPYRPLFGLRGGRQKDWERFLGLPREDRFSGAQLIGVYKDYLKKPSEESLDLLLLHNKEDLLGLTRLWPLLAYPALWNGGFTVDEMEADDRGDCLKISCSLWQPVPVSLHFHDMKALSAFEAKEGHCSFTLPLLAGELKHFFDDPSQYYYLPAEDRAIHRSVGRYVEKAYRIPADSSNCYVRKSGFFVPVPGQKERYGFQTGSRISYNSLVHYRKSHKDRETYMEFDEIFAKPDGFIRDYLTDLLHQASIRQCRHFYADEKRRREAGHNRCK